MATSLPDSECWDYPVTTGRYVQVAEDSIQELLLNQNAFGKCEHETILYNCPCEHHAEILMCSKCDAFFCDSNCCIEK